MAGILLILGGLFLMAKTIALFASVGNSILAPWDAPQKLVVRGPYRHVRNPMISGVLAVLLGEAIVFGSLLLLGWFVFAAALSMIYIPLAKEPGLARRFGRHLVGQRPAARRVQEALQAHAQAVHAPGQSVMDGRQEVSANQDEQMRRVMKKNFVFIAPSNAVFRLDWPTTSDNPI